MQGWIKLHRRIMQSETFSKLNAIQQLIAIYIILNANHEDGVWYDRYKNIEVNLKRGQLITSRKKIVNEWFKGDKEVTEQKVRTTLSKLEKLNFLTITSTNNYTLVEVRNYNLYQTKGNETNQVNNQEATKSQPRENQEKTTNKNDKNVKNDKEQIPYAEIVSYLNEKAGKKFKPSANRTKEQIKARWNEGHRLDDFKKVIDVCCQKWKGQIFGNGQAGDTYLQPSTLFNGKFDERLNWSMEKQKNDGPVKTRDQIEHEKMLKEMGYTV